VSIDGLRLRPSERLEIHIPVRPSWRCRACRADWPCQRRRDQLRRVTAGSTTTLGLWMLSYYTLAVKDLPNIPVATMYRRMFGWIRASDRSGRPG
jgi:hypothetical protein